MYFSERDINKVLNYECLLTTTEVNCRGGSRASVGAAAPAALPRVFLQMVSL